MPYTPEMSTRSSPDPTPFTETLGEATPDTWMRDPVYPTSWMITRSPTPMVGRSPMIVVAKWALSTSTTALPGDGVEVILMVPRLKPSTEAVAAMGLGRSQGREFVEVFEAVATWAGAVRIRVAGVWPAVAAVAVIAPERTLLPALKAMALASAAPA